MPSCVPVAAAIDARPDCRSSNGLDRGPAAVEVRALVKVFGSSPALLGIDLVVGRGEICGLVGANGAGKTTLLRVLSTALRPTSGSIRVLGHDVLSQAARVRAGVDLIAAAGGFYPDLTARENLAFVASMRGIEDAQASCPAVLRSAHLQDVADDPVRTFSTGMLRRLSLARLLLTRPELALIDEPYAALDDDGRRLADAIMSAARAEGRTVVVAAHERERIAGLADVVHELERGVLVASTAGQRRRDEREVAAP